MALVFFGLIMVWLYVIHLALGVFGEKYFRHFALGKVAILTLLIIVTFFIEHFYGLGENLNLFAPILFLGALYIIYRKGISIALLGKDWPFIFGFLFALVWRLLYPDINQSTERITDLYFIANYARGETLPPLNLWYPPYSFDFYYAFQHYAAALMGRVLHLSPGWTYNLCFALFFGYMASLVYEATKKYTASTWFACLLMCVVLVGGTGISPIFEMIRTPGTNDSAVVASMRFIGVTELNTSIAHYFASADRDIQSVPVETFGYLLFIGDYHPPLSAYTLLMVWLSAFMLWQLSSTKSDTVHNKATGTSHSQAAFTLTPIQKVSIPMLLGFCVPLALVCSIWVFPLMVITCVLYVAFSKKIAGWEYVIGGAIISTCLLFPYLSHLITGALGASIKLTPSSQYSPILLLLLQFWPVLIPVLLLAFVKANRKLALFFLVNFFVLFVFTEVFYVEDGAIEQFNRTNSTMKWWGWLFIIGQIPAAWLVFKNGVKWQKIVLSTVLLVPTVAHFYHMLPHYKTGRSVSISALSGDHWLTHDNQVFGLMKYLKVLPDGIVLEHIPGESYVEAPAMSMFATKPVFIGWHHHLWTWGQGSRDLMNRNNEHRDFYKGNMVNPTQWLLSNNIDYVIWKPKDGSKETFQKIHADIDSTHYIYHSFTLNDEQPLGIWVRANKNNSLL